jgi:hypothetical protein
MQLKSRKNHTVVITCNATTLDEFRKAFETLETHYWSVARAEPGGSYREKLSRECADAARRLRYELERFVSNATTGRPETVEMTDADGSTRYHFNYKDL